MQDSADATRFFGGDAMSLTGDAQGTAATVSDAGGIEHTHRLVMFGASFLRIKRGPLPAKQCAVRLRKKILPCQASCSCCSCPLRGRDQLAQPGRSPGMIEIQCEGGQTR